MSERQTVVIVDDDQDVLDRMQQLLEEDYEVLVASDWTAVSSLVFRSKCDLILMDVNLPVISGDRLAQILQASGTSARRPPKIVFFSSADEDELRRLSEQPGVAGYIVKSMRPSLLLGEIERFLDAPPPSLSGKPQA